MGKRSRRTGNREERNLVAYPFTAGVVYHEGWRSVTRDAGAGCMRVPMIILAAVYFAFSGSTAVVGAFADGGTIPERIVVSLAHPAAAVLLLIAVSFSKPISTGLRKFTLVLLLVAIAADLVLAVLIGLAVVKGDWFLPLVFAVVPVVGVAYLAGGGRQDHPRSA